MNPPRENPSPSRAATVDETLRLLAHAPAPDGLEKRIHAVLQAAPRHERLLLWPAAPWVEGGWAAGWVRAAAAAAIVTVVAGGGWGVYMRVQHHPDRVMAPAVAPAPVNAGTMGGFSTAGAMRTPQTLKGPAPAQPQKLKKKAGARTTGKRADGASAPQPPPAPK